MQYGTKLKIYLKKQVNSELVYKDIDKYIRTKVDLNSTPFLSKSKFENEYYTCTSVLLVYSIVNINNKYYPVVLSNEYKYIFNKEEIKIMSTINEYDDFDD